MRGSFKKYSFFSEIFNSANSFEEQSFFYDYFTNLVDEKQLNFLKPKNSKRSFDFSNNFDQLSREKISIERDLLLHLLTDNENSTYIINDEENHIMVIISKYLVYGSTGHG